jgi:hypothetical protein
VGFSLQCTEAGLTHIIEIIRNDDGRGGGGFVLGVPSSVGGFKLPRLNKKVRIMLQTRMPWATRRGNKM